MYKRQVQYAYENKWRRISVAAILGKAVGDVIGNIDLSKYWSKSEIEIAGEYLTVLGEKIKSGDSDLWFGHQFADYLNQAVKTDSDVQFRDLLIRSFKSLNFAAGPLGAGVGMVNDDELQTDKLLVRKLMFVLELVIQKIRHQGGILILSPASMKISKVVDGGSYWKCYFENDGGNIANEFVVDDQARLQNFSGNNIKYLWARVTAIGSDYIHLSKSDKDGGGIPVEGDDLVQLGHRTNPDRQDAVLISSVNGEVGIVTYFGINSFDLSGKEGSWFGKHGGKKGAMIRGEFHVESGSTGLDAFQEYTALLEYIGGVSTSVDVYKRQG